MSTVHHRYLTVDGHQLFFREAGDPQAPALVLLHCFPTSSYMFRDLVPALADRYHVIAPDHLGFGLSDAPPVEQFDYTFDALTALTQGLLRALKIDRYAIYVQDYGAPIGWRLALADPGANHGDHQPKRKRVRRRLRGELLEGRRGLSDRADRRNRRRGAAIPHLGRHPLAVRHRRAGRDASQSGILASRLCA